MAKVSEVCLIMTCFGAVLEGEYPIPEGFRFPLNKVVVDLMGIECAGIVGLLITYISLGC